MQALKIGDVGLSLDASRAFHSMLGIVQSRAAVQWELSPPEQADVIVAPSALDTGTMSGTCKATILVVEERHTWIDAPFVLRYPFRVMQLLSILDAVSAQLSPEHSQSSDDDWRCAQSLRQTLEQGDTTRWHVAVGSHGEQLWIRPDLAAIRPSALAALKTGGFKTKVLVPSSDAPDDDCITMPRQHAAWYLGHQASPDLAPWLSNQAAYRLRRWPDFGRIGATPALLRLSAAAAASAMTPAALAAATQRPQAEAYRFLNAASLADLLTSTTRNDAPSQPARSVPRTWSRLLDGLRRQLGMANA